MRDFIRQKLHENFSDGYVAYHGSTAKINKFIDDFVGGKDAIDQHGPGIYFTSSINNARYYGEYVYTVKLAPKKIVSITEGKNASRKELEWLV